MGHGDVGGRLPRVVLMVILKKKTRVHGVVWNYLHTFAGIRTNGFVVSILHNALSPKQWWMCHRNN